MVKIREMETAFSVLELEIVYKKKDVRINQVFEYWFVEIRNTTRIANSTIIILELSLRVSQTIVTIFSSSKLVSRAINFVPRVLEKKKKTE